MFEIMNPLSHSDDPRRARQNAERDGQSLCAAVNAFNEGIRKGRVRKFWTKLIKRTSQLLDLSDYRFKIRNSIYRGVQIVPIDQIHGSEGRADDFDDHFHPLSRRMKDRWMSVAIAHHQGMALPPIQLLLIGGQYFVRDGHHRISVARAFGQCLVDAEVTEVFIDSRSPWEKKEIPAAAQLAECCYESQHDGHSSG